MDPCRRGSEPVAACTGDALGVCDADLHFVHSRGPLLQFKPLIIVVGMAVSWGEGVFWGTCAVSVESAGSWFRYTSRMGSAFAQGPCGPLRISNGNQLNTICLKFHIRAFGRECAVFGGEGPGVQGRGECWNLARTWSAPRGWRRKQKASAQRSAPLSPPHTTKKDNFAP